MSKRKYTLEDLRAKSRGYGNVGVGARQLEFIFEHYDAEKARADKMQAVAVAADVVMHHFADSHWQEGSFVKMVDAMEPLRQALLEAGYGLPGNGVPA